MKKRFLLLLVTFLLTASFFALVSCNSEDGKGTSQNDITNNAGTEDLAGETEKETVKETEKENENQEDNNENAEHVHSFGEWETIFVASCFENGLRIRKCACGIQQEEMVYEQHKVLGDEKFKYCIDCHAVKSSSELAFPPEIASDAKTTVTREEWINAFDLVRLESFTLDFEQLQLNVNGYYPKDLEEIPEEVNWDLVEWKIYGEVIAANVKYNGGCIYADRYWHYLEAATDADEIEAEENQDAAGGMIEFEEFREIDWFVDSQIYEMLDDSIYDLEGFGYDQAVYSEKTKSYVIKYNYEGYENVNIEIEICFENGYVKGIELYLIQDYSEEGEYDVQKGTMIFGDINADKKVAEIDANDVLAQYGSLMAGIANASDCKIIYEWEEENPEDFELALLIDIVESFEMENVDYYQFNEKGISYMAFSGNMNYLEGEEKTEAEDMIYVYMNEDGQIEEIELWTQECDNEYYTILNSSYKLSY
ncbi:MAG: hypothetical protein E7642_04440 [Ruminococcaceae bacterium]|nr:hypothetical protein [Oscillospiraceae bacterium]